MRIGFRGWTLKPTDIAPDGDTNFEFLPISYGPQAGPWTLLGTNQALCHATKKHSPDEVPAEGCSCGFYCWYRPESVQASPMGAVMCSGGIVGWGDEGFRAQYAQILAIVEPDISCFPPPPPPQPDTDLVANLYMLKYGDVAIEEFGKAIQHLHTLYPTLPVGLNYRLPNAEELKTLYDEMQSKKSAVSILNSKYEDAIGNYDRYVDEFTNNAINLLRAKVPFPIFKDMPALVDYAKEFGEMGPPPDSRKLKT